MNLRTGSSDKETLPMIDIVVEILLVEDNANDELLLVRALKKLLVVKNIGVARDGAEALAYAFCTGPYADRASGNPRLILLDKKLPLVDGMEVLRQSACRPTHLPDSDRDADQFGRGARPRRELSTRSQ